MPHHPIGMELFFPHRYKILGENTMAKDPVCGMMIEENKAAGTAFWNGKTYYFCIQAAKLDLKKNTRKNKSENREQMAQPQPVYIIDICCGRPTFPAI
jgi:YHS domain-containing protein